MLISINWYIYHNWLPRDPLSGHHFLLWRTDNMWSSDPEDRAIVYIRLRKLSRLSFVHIFQRRRQILKYANCLTIRRLADNGLDFEQVVKSFLKTNIIWKYLLPQNLRIVLLLCFSKVVGMALDLKTGPLRLHGWFSGNFFELYFIFFRQGVYYLFFSTHAFDHVQYNVSFCQNW